MWRRHNENGPLPGKGYGRKDQGVCMSLQGLNENVKRRGWGGRPRILETFEVLQAWERYMGGESVKVLGAEYGLTADAVRKRLREQAERLGYGKGLSLRQVRRLREGKSKRELGAERKRMLDWERSLHGVCYFCSGGLADHARCVGCGVLLHGENSAYTCGCGLQHGMRLDADRCVRCG